MFHSFFYKLERVIIGLVVIVFVFSLFALVNQFSKKESVVEIKTLDFVYPAKIGEKNIWLAKAETEKERITGLSGQNQLEDNQGLLFIFDFPAKYSIWMKDMKFSIDVFWLDEEMRIIFIEKGFSPNSFPRAVAPPAPAKFVLETNSGFADLNEIQIGDRLEIF